MKKLFLLSIILLFCSVSCEHETDADSVRFWEDDFSLSYGDGRLVGRWQVNACIDPYTMTPVNNCNTRVIFNFANDSILTIIGHSPIASQGRYRYKYWGLPTCGDLPLANFHIYFSNNEKFDGYCYMSKDGRKMEISYRYNLYLKKL